MIQLFIPGKPQGKGRARTFTMSNKDGSPRMVTGKNGKKRPMLVHSTPSNTRTYEGLIRTQAIEKMNELGLSITHKPIRLEMAVDYPITSTWPKWKQELAVKGIMVPTIKPDFDNVKKAISDALNGVVWHDDAQIVAGVYHCKFSKTPGVHINVVELDKLPAQIKTKAEAGL